MDILTNKHRKARKIHTCDWCGGAINIKEIYRYSTFVYDGDISSWKNHIKCGEIASKLNMFDELPEGVDSCTFHEIIKDEFMRIWIEKDEEHYESKEFVIPDFLEQLDFVCKHHEMKDIKTEKLSNE